MAQSIELRLEKLKRRITAEGVLTPRTGALILDELIALNNRVTSLETLAGDLSIPVFVSAIVDDLAPDTIVITFDDVNDLDTINIPDTSYFEVTGVGAAVTSIEVVGKTVRIVLDNTILIGDEPVIEYTAPDNAEAMPLQDKAGNWVVSFNENVTNNTTDIDIPTLDTVTVEALTPTLIVLTYDDYSDLDEESVPATTDFTLAGITGNPTITTVTIDGSAKTVTLTLSGAVVALDVVVLDYTPGANPIQDTAGNQADALEDQAVDNNVV